MNASVQSSENSTVKPNYPNGLRAFTFWILKTLYAVDISKVLTISQDLSNIQSVPSKGKGLLGMIEFQGHAIPVIDFASLLNLKSGTQTGKELIHILKEKEGEHYKWINALEKSILNGDAFLKEKDPNQCAFGLWRNNFTTTDKTLQDIMDGFDEPHRRIHKLAHKLLTKRDEGKVEEAIKDLTLERKTTLRRLNKHFIHAREHIQDSSRCVLLYLTENGITPTIALQIDKIYDVIDFKKNQFMPMDSLKEILNAEKRKLITHYIKIENTADCLLVETSFITEIIKNEH